MEFSGKPTALVTAGTGGAHGHKSLLGTLLIIEAKMIAETQVVVSSVKSKVVRSPSGHGEISDADTRTQISLLVESLFKITSGLTSGAGVTPEQFLKPPDFRTP